MDRPVPSSPSPIQRLLAVEAASGVILLATTAVALVWANTAWRGSYQALWRTPIGIPLGEWSVVRPLQFWINEGLMTVFFFVVGLEIRREMSRGELATLRQAALPLAAAIGGMLVPAVIFAALNAGRAGASGWAIPMATDIAFAVGVLTLLGSRVPGALRVLLLGLAVIDDIGAILVIAVVFSGGIELTGLAIVVGGLGAVVALRAMGVRSPLAYLVPGIVVWIGLSTSGVHPTLAGVMLGLLTPARGHREALAPTERLLQALHPWVAFGVMPLFALANAGVVFGGADLGGDGLWLFLGVVLGLAVGKPLGIVAATFGASASGIASRSDQMSFRGIGLVGLVGGIGFTMSLFIAHLAFPPGPLLDTAKLAILVGSGVATVLGLAVGAAAFRRARV